MATRCGGYSDEKTGDADVIALFTSPEVIAAVATHLGVAVDTLEVVAYKSQVVSF